MIRAMKENESDPEEQRCDCGLAVEKSSLPRGWSVHLSQDEETRGEVWFRSVPKPLLYITLTIPPM